MLNTTLNLNPWLFSYFYVDVQSLNTTGLAPTALPYSDLLFLRHPQKRQTALRAMDARTDKMTSAERVDVALQRIRL